MMNLSGNVRLRLLIFEIKLVFFPTPPALVYHYVCTYRIVVPETRAAAKLSNFISVLCYVLYGSDIIFNQQP